METFILYLNKLNTKRNDLWQKPKPVIASASDEEWYQNQVVGRDPLNMSMKILSERAKLSRIYTNHCIRASVVTKLDEEGFEARHIMVVSSHKSENSIKNYASKCPEIKKKQMFDALAKPFAPTTNQQNNCNVPKTPQIGDESNTKNQVPTETATIPPPLDRKFELVDLFPNMDDDPLTDDNFLEAIEKIEKQNQKLLTKDKEISIKTPAPPAVTTNSVTSNYIQNFNPTMSLPHMVFPHSNVTINYNFNSK